MPQNPTEVCMHRCSPRYNDGTSKYLALVSYGKHFFTFLIRTNAILNSRLSSSKISTLFFKPFVCFMKLLLISFVFMHLINKYSVQRAVEKCNKIGSHSCTQTYICIHAINYEFQRNCKAVSFQPAASQVVLRGPRPLL
jgi:hypothetical protein